MLVVKGLSFARTFQARVGRVQAMAEEYKGKEVAVAVAEVDPMHRKLMLSLTLAAQSTGLRALHVRSAPAAVLLMCNAGVVCLRVGFCGALRAFSISPRHVGPPCRLPR